MQPVEQTSDDSDEEAPRLENRQDDLLELVACWGLGTLIEGIHFQAYEVRDVTSSRD